MTAAESILAPRKSMGFSPLVADPFKEAGFTPIIRSLLDTDLYKLTMLQPMLHQMPANTSVYRFVCRGTPGRPMAPLVPEINRQLDHLCRLRYTEDELTWLGARSYFKPDFIEFLRIFQLQRNHIEVRADGDDLFCEARGPQLFAMQYEIFVMAIVNELYFIPDQSPEVFAEGRARLQKKIQDLKAFGAKPRLRTPFEFFDFGTRRRFSRDWQEEVVGTLAKEVPEFFKGTSNMYLAKKYNLACIGTMAHEWLQTFQTTGVQLRQFQEAALDSWAREYRGDLGIALTDVVGIDAFLKVFDRYFALLFDGVRHDSGSPFVWGEKVLAHYAKLKVSALDKRLVFSDGLDIARAIELYETFGERVHNGFGIGTNLTNDLGPKSLSIVMKLVECNGQPTAKLPDTEGKTLCDSPSFLAYLQSLFPR